MFDNLSFENSIQSRRLKVVEITDYIEILNFLNFQNIL